MSRPLVSLVLAGSLLATGLTFASCSKNKSTNPQPVPGLELNSGNLTSGRVYQHTFANAGTFNYKCSIHSTMLATVTVAASSTNDSAFVSIVDFAFSPTSSDVKPGGHVRWVNNGAATHTVTSR